MTFWSVNYNYGLQALGYEFRNKLILVVCIPRNKILKDVGSKEQMEFTLTFYHSSYSWGKKSSTSFTPTTVPG